MFVLDVRAQVDLLLGAMRTERAVEPRFDIALKLDVASQVEFVLVAAMTLVARMPAWNQHASVRIFAQALVISDLHNGFKVW